MWLQEFENHDRRQPGHNRHREIVWVQGSKAEHALHKGQHQRDPQHTRADFPVPAIMNPRFADFALPALSLNEARNQHRDQLHRLAAACDALWIADLGVSLAESTRRAIWRTAKAPEGGRQRQQG